MHKSKPVQHHNQSPKMSIHMGDTLCFIPNITLFSRRKRVHYYKNSNFEKFLYEVGFLEEWRRFKSRFGDAKGRSFPRQIRKYLHNKAFGLIINYKLKKASKEIFKYSRVSQRKGASMSHALFDAAKESVTNLFKEGDESENYRKVDVILELQRIQNEYAEYRERTKHKPLQSLEDFVCVEIDSLSRNSVSLGFMLTHTGGSKGSHILYSVQADNTSGFRLVTKPIMVFQHNNEETKDLIASALLIPDVYKRLLNYYHNTVNDSGEIIEFDHEMSLLALELYNDHKKRQSLH